MRRRKTPPMRRSAPFVGDNSVAGDGIANAVRSSLSGERCTRTRGSRSRWPLAFLLSGFPAFSLRNGSHCDLCERLPVRICPESDAEDMKSRRESRLAGTTGKHVLFNQGSVVETWPLQKTVPRQTQFPSSTSTEQRDTRMDPPDWVKPSPGFQVGIYGWRKRCLYFLIVGLLVMVIINLALTLWVLKVMEFSSDGMGQLKIIPGGLQLSGQAVVLDALIASNIRSRKGQPISIESSRNFTVTTRDSGGRVSSRIVLDKDKLECLSKSFQVLDTKGSVLFSANEEEVVVGAEVLKVTGAGGAVFDGSVQTPLIRAASGSELKLESPTRSLEIKAPLGVAIESRAGDISASCLTDLKLQSLDGAIRLDSENVYFPKLRKVNPGPGGSRSGRNDFASSNSRQTSLGISYEIYQLCACENGRLFLAPPYGLCATEDNTICR